MRAGRDAQRLGRFWESYAAEFLTRQDFRIIAQGYRCRLGELDIIGSDGPGLVIVEVRARKSSNRGSAVETIGNLKRRRIVNATRHFLMHNPSWSSQPIRFDVIAVDGIETSKPRIRWVQNAFDGT